MAAPAGAPIEFLRDGRALVAWLVAAGLIDADDAPSLRRLGAPALDGVAHRAVALREWLRPVVARSAGARPRTTAEELRHLNGILAAHPRVEQVAATPDGYALRRRVEWGTADAALAPLAGAIADLLTRIDFAQIRRCASPECTLWFLDRSKSHRRQWCSMAVCGNRAKVAAHRRRQES